MSDFIDTGLGFLSEASTTLHDLRDAVDGALVLANPRQKETEWDFMIEKTDILSSVKSALTSPGKFLSEVTDAVQMTDLKFKVRSVSFPRLKLLTQRTKWGTNPFIGYDHPELVNVLVEEDIFFQTNNYFQSWQDDMFDSENNVFKSGQDSTHIYRQGVLTIGDPIPVVGVTGLTLKMSNLKFLGFEAQTMVYDGEDCLMYNLTFAVETIRQVGLTPNNIINSIF